MNALRRRARTSGLASSLLALAAVSGCSNLYLHSEKRQQQAEASVKAWGELEHASLFATERENLKQLAEAEQQTQVRVAASIREYLAAVIVKSGPKDETPADRQARSVGNAVLERARQGFTALVGPIDSYDKRTRAGDELRSTQRNIADVSARLEGLGSPVAGCAALGDGSTPPGWQAWWQALTPRARAGADDDVRTLREDCGTLMAKVAVQRAAGVDATPVGKLKAAVDLRDADQRELAVQRAAFQVARLRYQEALKAHEAAEAAARAAPDDATLAAKVGAAAGTLGKAIDLLRGLQNALAQEFIAGETLDSIDASLSAIASGKAGEQATKGVVFAIQAPALIDRYRAALAAARKPLVLPLLIRRNAEQLHRDAAAADVKLLQAKVETSERIVAAVQAQAAALRRAMRELEAAGKLNAAALNQPWAEALKATEGEARRLLLSGTGRYLDAASRLEGERYRLEYAHIALDHERGLSYAESSVAQWANLIGAGVGQLEAFARGGIDTAVLTDLAKVLGLFWIGHGVNQ